MHPKFNPTGVQTHDLQIMTRSFHFTEMPDLEKTARDVSKTLTAHPFYMKHLPRW